MMRIETGCEGDLLKARQWSQGQVELRTAWFQRFETTGRLEHECRPEGLGRCGAVAQARLAQRRWEYLGEAWQVERAGPQARLSRQRAGAQPDHWGTVRRKWRERCHAQRDHSGGMRQGRREKKREGGWGVVGAIREAERRREAGGGRREAEETGSLGVRCERGRWECVDRADWTC